MTVESGSLSDEQGGSVAMSGAAQPMQASRLPATVISTRVKCRRLRHDKAPLSLTQLEPGCALRLLEVLAELQHALSAICPGNDNRTSEPHHLLGTIAKLHILALQSRPRNSTPHSCLSRHIVERANTISNVHDQRWKRVLGGADHEMRIQILEPRINQSLQIRPREAIETKLIRLVLNMNTPEHPSRLRTTAARGESCCSP